MKSCAWLCMLCTLVSQCARALSKELPIEGTLSTPKLITRNGYDVKEVKVVTQDGYKLPMFRMRARRSTDEARGPPVLLVHGMVGSSSDFIILGPGKSLGYLLADAGYDVFLGNLRFTQYATHVNISRNSPAFWDFGVDESGLQDAPAMVDGVFRATGAPGLHYIGYSLGATSYVIMCDVRPDLASRILSFVALAPAVHMSNLRPLARVVLGFNLLKLLEVRGINPLVLGGRFQRATAANFCSPKYQSEDICYTLMFFFVGEDFEQVDWSMSPIVFAKIQPSTIKQMVHFLQMALTDTICRYDYGEAENMKRYGSSTPPAYNMTANKAPVTIFYGNNDLLTPAEDIIKIAEIYKSSNTPVLIKKVPWKKFNHFDFIYAKDIDKLVNEDVVEILNNRTRVLDIINNTT